MSKCGCENKGVNVYRSAIGREMLVNQGEYGDDLRCGSEIGEPRMLTVIAPVVFDEVGINLCRYIPFPQEIMVGYPETQSAILEVVDIDFENEGCTVKTLANNPYGVRVELSDLLVTFSAKLLDCRGKYIETIMFRALYLDSNPNNDYFSDESNPCKVTLDLYAPYGTSYKNVECNSRIEPVIEYLGFSTRNNSVPQGICVQALAKVVDCDDTDSGMSIGLTLTVESVYDIEYKIPHGGLAIAPKAALDCAEVKNGCHDFIEGRLLERSIKPLDLGSFAFDEFKDDCHCKKHDCFTNL